jgi:hypothetical protein
MARAKKVAAPVVTVPQIMQNEILAFEEIRVKAKSLSDQAKALQKVIDTQEAALTAKLTAGATVETGSYVCMLTQAPGRVSVSWKNEAIKLAEASGQNAGIYEATVKAMNPAGMVTSLLITKVA